MSLAHLKLAAELGGTALLGPGGPLVLVERSRAHGLPQIVVLGREGVQLLEPLPAWEGSEAQINLTALLPAPGTDLEAALLHHRRRIGSVAAALDASLPWLDGSPMLAKRLPGRIRAKKPLPLERTSLGPLEKAELKSFLAGWNEERRELFREPAWEQAGNHVETWLWPEVPLPQGAELLYPPLVLPTATALSDALRLALRQSLDTPIPLLPLPADPSGLHALKRLTPHIAAFHGPAPSWELAFQKLATLPAPPHFCARC